MVTCRFSLCPPGPALALVLLLSAAACSPAPLASTSGAESAERAQAQAPTPAPSPGASETSALRATLVQLFSGYEHQPSSEELRALAEPAALVDELLKMHADAELEAHLQLHALRALHVFIADDARVLDHYLMLLQRDGLPDRELHATLRNLARGMARAQRVEEALPAIEPWLASEDYATRATAIAALTDLGSPGAQAALQRHLDAEAESALRASVQRALRGTEHGEVLR